MWVLCPPTPARVWSWHFLVAEEHPDTEAADCAVMGSGAVGHKDESLSVSCET